MFHAQYLQGKFGSMEQHSKCLLYEGVDDQSQLMIIKAHINTWIALARGSKSTKMISQNIN